MNAFLDRPSVCGIRWIARVFGTLIGLMVLFEFGESTRLAQIGASDLRLFDLCRTSPILCGLRRRMV